MGKEALDFMVIFIVSLVFIGFPMIKIFLLTRILLTLGSMHQELIRGNKRADSYLDDLPRYNDYCCVDEEIMEDENGSNHKRYRY